ncbi:MAG: DNA polymerase III subunit chi [Rhodoferax sp.]|nr:DNA polymerase III subunit chi [Rhodoferax sp.]MCF8210267.1 DNA polymerase III subunit chi [Rhodoferax sp.]
MTEIAFHFGVPDKVAYACRLLRKALTRDAWVTVACETSTQPFLSAALWSIAPSDFVVHCGQTDDTAMQMLSPLLLTTDLDVKPGKRRVLVNLRDTVVTGYTQFERLIEVVSTDAIDRENARRRWKHYTQLGYAIVRHDVNVKGSQT